MACSVYPSCFPALAYDGARWETGLLSALLNFDGRDVGLFWHVAGGKQATAEDGCSSYCTKYDTRPFFSKDLMATATDFPMRIVSPFV